MPTNTHVSRANRMAPAFGTSGLRGLVTDLTDDLITGYCHAFAALMPCDTVYVGRDLRPSSPHIAGIVGGALAQTGATVIDCGEICTPALAHLAMSQGACAIMVTGSHIPADRNGLKFYLPSGEITKAHEAAISASFASGHRITGRTAGRITALPDAATGFIARYTGGFAGNTLGGLRIGMYRHSSVARDMLTTILTSLGATVIPLGQSETFIPVDTEASSPQTRAQLRAWCTEHRLDALVSTDGDGDRPLVTDETGGIIAGDILGVLTAWALGASHVVVPVTSNGMIGQLPDFEQVVLTQIGSPFVIDGMERCGAAKVVGFEPNGGFLLGFQAGEIAPLLTRDCVLPIVAVLGAANKRSAPLSALVAELPAWYSAADRLQNIDRPRAEAFLQSLIDEPALCSAFFAPFGGIGSVDLTDGLRITLPDGVTILHLRLSGNAPEFRTYAQASDRDRATGLQQTLMQRVAQALGHQT